MNINCIYGWIVWFVFVLVGCTAPVETDTGTSVGPEPEPAVDTDGEPVIAPIVDGRCKVALGTGSICPPTDTCCVNPAGDGYAHCRYEPVPDDAPDACEDAGGTWRYPW